MFREMRRFKQELTTEKSIEILNNATSGVLAVLGDNDYPYGVPVSYVYDDSKIYIHSATSGHKIDALNHHSKVSFCVIDQDLIVPEKYTTYFRSVIVFGKAHFIEDENDKRKAIELLALKYSSDYKEGIPNEISGGMKHLCLIQIDIEKISGKEAIELVK